MHSDRIIDKEPNNYNSKSITENVIVDYHPYSSTAMITSTTSNIGVETTRVIILAKKPQGFS